MNRRKLEDWLSFHVFYHDDRDALVCDGVRPVIEAFCREGRLQRFFFIRHLLGGPHVRIRLEPAPGQREEVRRQVLRTVTQFVRQRPSTAVVSDEEIGSMNREILSNDDDADDRIFPNNTVVEMPFQAEEARYGGRSLLDESLTFFEVSSRCVLDVLGSGLSMGNKLGAGFELLAHQAASLTTESDELSTLCSHAEDWIPNSRPLLDKADRLFDARTSQFTSVARKAMSMSPGDQDHLSRLQNGARALSKAIASSPRPIRLRIKTSQQHMTANRLGLRNTDEVYLGRLLQRAFESLGG